MKTKYEKDLHFYLDYSSAYSIMHKDRLYTKAKKTQKAGTPFVIPFENDETRTGLTPYTLKHSETVTTTSGENYTVNCLRYKGWDEESGDYNVIEIKKRQHNPAFIKL